MTAARRACLALACLAATGCGAAPLPTADPRRVELGPDAFVYLPSRPADVDVEVIGAPTASIRAPRASVAVRIQRLRRGDDPPDATAAVRGERVGALFRHATRWIETSDRELQTRYESDDLVLDVHVDCRGTCPPSATEWGRDGVVFWRSDRPHSARLLATGAYAPDLDRAGAGLSLTPVLERPYGGGLSLGVALGFVGFGVSQRMTLTAVVDYDLSWLWSRSAGGRDRTLQLSLGIEAGLGLRLTDTPFGQGLEIAAAFDPYAELRVLLAPEVAIPLRLALLGTVGRGTDAAAALMTGIFVQWGGS